MRSSSQPCLAGARSIPIARPPARAGLAELGGRRVALSARGERPLREAALEPPVVLCLGSEREGLPAELEAESVRIDVRSDSLNVAMAATVALYEVEHRMRGHA